MFKQVIFLLMIFSSIQSFAFQDTTLHKAIADLKVKLLHAQSPQQRLGHFEKFRELVFDRMQTMNLPKTATEKKEFSELNDFENFIYSIELKKISKETCTLNQNKIIGGFVVNQDYDEPDKIDVTPEAQEALNILADLCQ